MNKREISSCSIKLGRSYKEKKKKKKRKKEKEKEKEEEEEEEKREKKQGRIKYLKESRNWM